MSDMETRFATFGPEVSAGDVPALISAGVTVWSFGYGDDEDEFDTINEGDLWAWEDLADRDGVVASWGPFRIDGGTTPQDIVDRFTNTGDVDRAIRLLQRSGYTVLAAQDIEWGTCTQNTDDGPSGPHRVSLSMCVWCLEFDPI